MAKKKDIGFDFLNSDNCGFLRNSDEGDSYKYSDGGGYFHGNDGSEGYIYSDGSGYYNGVDGSKGYIYSDGSGYFHGADGSNGNKYSDGSGYYQSADGSNEFIYSKDTGDYDDSQVETSHLSKEVDNKSLEGVALISVLTGVGIAWLIGTKNRREERLRQKEDAERIQEEKDRISQEKQAYNSIRRKEFYKKHRKGILITVLVCIITLIATIGYVEYQKLIPAGLSSGTTGRYKYKEVVEQFEKAGFTNISVKAIEDLELNELSEENNVSSVEIGGKGDFNKTSKFYYDSQVVISYHTAKIIQTPVSSKDAKGENYVTIVSKFRDSGFENIVMEIEYDLINGWFNKEGEIESITISGDSKFDSGKSCRIDSEVKITYHAFKKDKNDSNQ